MVIRKKGGNNRPKSNITNVSALYSTDIWDAVKDFQDTMQQRGYGTHNIKVDSGLIRVKHPDDKKGTLNVYYEFFSLPIPAGYMGYWKTGEYFTWCFKDKKELTYAEKKAFAKQIEKSKQQSKEEQEKRYEEGRKRALIIWNGLYPASSNFPYAKDKRMGVTGMRQGKSGLAVPLYQNGKIVGIQFIDEKGNKRFLTGSRISGSYFWYGNLKKPFDTVYIAEGVSSGFAVHVLADYAPVFCAMNAGNLKNVACSVRKKWSEKKIVIAADNDVRKDKNATNTGVKYANEASLICGGRVAIPEHPEGKKVDWNDLYCEALDKVGKL